LVLSLGGYVADLAIDVGQRGCAPPYRVLDHWITTARKHESHVAKLVVVLLQSVEQDIDSFVGAERTKEQNQWSLAVSQGVDPQVARIDWNGDHMDSIGRHAEVRVQLVS
jgi:hypothetical protein